MELLHNDLAAVWHLLRIVQENLLADNLRGEESQVLVREHVLVVPRRSDWQGGNNCVVDVVEVEPFLCGCREYGRIRQSFLPPSHQFQHLFLSAYVYLVDDQHNRAFDPLEFSNPFLVLVRLFHGVCHIKDDVRVSDCRLHEIHHALL